MIFMSPVSGIAQGKPVSTTYDPADQPYIEILVPLSRPNDPGLASAS